MHKYPLSVRFGTIPYSSNIILNTLHRKHLNDLNSQFFFETGAMATPTKLQKPTILGLGVPNGHTLEGSPLATMHYTKLILSLKTQKMHFLPVFELMVDSLTTI